MVLRAFSCSLLATEVFSQYRYLCFITITYISGSADDSKPGSPRGNHCYSHFSCTKYSLFLCIYFPFIQLWLETRTGFDNSRRICCNLCEALFLCCVSIWRNVCCILGNRSKPDGSSLI